MNPDKLNDIIKKKSKGNNYLSYQLHQMFFFEHILMRIEKSNYRNNIILKGGVLLSSIIGEELRTTKDINATLKSIPITKKVINKIFNEILSIDINDNIRFEIIDVKDIRLEDNYNAFRINVNCFFEKIKTNTFIEITTGDIITPREITYQYNSIFSKKKIKVMAYTVETIIAEKFETIIRRNITTTRAKDFYDIFILLSNSNIKINKENLIKAINNTFKYRNTSLDKDYLSETINIIKNSEILRNVFDNYKSKMTYIKDIEYKDTVEKIEKIISIL